MARTNLSKRNLRFPLDSRNRDKLHTTLADHDTVADNVAPQGVPPTVTTGAIDPDVPVTKLSITGTIALTLADGTREGQRIQLCMIVAASVPAGTLTPVTYADGTTLYFDAVGQSAILEWHATGGWHSVGGSGFVIA